MHDSSPPAAQANRPSILKASLHGLKPQESLVGRSAIEGTIHNGLGAAAFGAAWGFSHAFWYATPKKLARLNILRQTAIWGVLGGLYQGVTVFAANTRNKHDSFNQGIGGLVTGAVTGFGLRGSIGFGVYYATTFAASAFAYDFVINRHFQRKAANRYGRGEQGRRVDEYFEEVTPHDPFKDRMAESTQ